VIKAAVVESDVENKNNKEEKAI